MTVFIMGQSTAYIC